MNHNSERWNTALLPHWCLQLQEEWAMKPQCFIRGLPVSFQMHGRNLTPLFWVLSFCLLRSAVLEEKDSQRPGCYVKGALVDLIQSAITTYVIYYTCSCYCIISKIDIKSMKQEHSIIIILYS